MFKLCLSFALLDAIVNCKTRTCRTWQVTKAVVITFFSFSCCLFFDFVSAISMKGTAAAMTCTSIEELSFDELNDRGQSYAGVLPYIDVVENAIRDDFLFEEFKSHDDYKAVLEHVSTEMGNL